MLGLLVIILVSWVFLHFIEKKNLAVLGFMPVKKRIIQFAIGMLFIMLISLLKIYIESIILTVEWKLQTLIQYDQIFESFLYHLRSALTEDLVFRGAVLYVLINRIGAKWAIFLSSFFFGIYHVFSYGMLGERIIPILYVILITGFTGYVWAFTFYKAKSILMPLGFHLGSNFLLSFFYKSEPFGELIFIQLSRVTLSGWDDFYFSLFSGLFPSLMTVFFVKLLFRKEVESSKSQLS